MTSVACLRVLTTIIGLSLTTCARAETFKPLRAADAVERIGVVTHFNYTDGAYANVDKAADALKYIGVTHLRDQTPTPWVGGAAPLATYERLMDRGLRFNFLALGGNFDFETTAAQLRQLQKSRPGMIDAVEGFNEVDHTPVSYDGRTGPEGAKAAQLALYTGVGGDTTLKHLPVYDLTGADWPERGVKRADFANVHLYTQNGNPPNFWFNEAADKSEALGLPLVVSEFGYASNPESGWMVIGVDERTQAKGILLGVFTAFSRNIERTYLYELLDEKPDPTMKAREFHFGLFSSDYRPKVSATALHNLRALLDDPSSVRQTFKPANLEVNVDGNPDTIHTMVIAKGDGSRWIAMWNNTAFWDRATGRPIESPPLPVTFTVPGGLKARALYDPMVATTPVKSYTGETRVTVDVPDHPVLLEVRP